MKIGIMQLNPHTFWNRGGGEVHAAKYLKWLPSFGCEAEYFDYLNPKKYDIVHIFGANVQLAEWALYAQKEGIKVVHTPILFPSRNTLKYRFFLKLDAFLPFPTSLRMRKEMLEAPSLIIANTQEEKSYISRAYGIGEKKIKVLGTGVDSDLLSFRPESRFLPQEVSEKLPFALMVGRVTPLKRQLEVLRMLKGSGLNLVLVGPPDSSETSYINEIERIISENPHQFVWIKGLRPESDSLRSIYAYASCHILFSKTDVAPLVNMEAAALGTPICTVAHITVKEIMGNLAHYISEENVVETIRGCINQTGAEREKESAKLQEFIRQKFTWEALVEKNVEWYKALLS